jgi:poly(hydroxyalkanoate) depolymerase family esterase
LSLLFSLSSFAQTTLQQITSFGKNPGNLRMFFYVPKDVKPNAGLVVLLHGCAQAASEFDDETGWVQLADKEKFIVLLPQQNVENNSSRCFNWFSPTHISRDGLETSSIIEMIDLMQKNHSIDASKVFITGLSAGGAMSSVMIASYPERFAAAAIVAGVPFGCATSMSSAFSCMSGFSFPAPTPEQRGTLVRNAAGNYTGPWPRVLVIQGTSDELVSFKNAQFNVDQWVNVHGLTARDRVETTVGSNTVAQYKNNKNVTVVSFLGISGFRHGYPINPSAKCGSAGKYVLASNVCAAEITAKFFNLL